MVNIANECSTTLSGLSTNDVKSNMSYFEIPVGQDWRVDMMLNLIDIRSDLLNIDNFDRTELDDILLYVCST